MPERTTIRRIHHEGRRVIFGYLELREIPNTPPAPHDAGAANVYLKDQNFVIQTNEGGTVYYTYADLTSPATNWSHGTVAP